LLPGKSEFSPSFYLLHTEHGFQLIDLCLPLGRVVFPEIAKIEELPFNGREILEVVE